MNVWVLRGWTQNCAESLLSKQLLSNFPEDDQVPKAGCIAHTCPGYTPHHFWDPLNPQIVQTIWVSDGFGCTAKCMKKPVQRRSKKGRDRCVHGAGEQLPNAIAFTGTGVEGLDSQKIIILEKKKIYEAFTCTRKENSSNRNVGVRKWKDTYNATSTKSIFSLL